MTINTSGDNIPTFWQNTAAGGTPITGGDQGNLTVREEAAVDAAAQLAGSYVDAMVPPPFNLGNLGGGQTVALGSIHGSAREATVIATLSAATGILTITGLEAGTRVYIRLTQDATGNRSFSLSVGGSVSQHAVDYRPLKPTVFLLMATSATTYQLLTLPSVDTSIEFGWAPGSWIRTMDATNRNADLDDMVATGAKWLRVEADQWAVQETDATTYNWAALDALVNAATSRGLKVLLMCGVTPPWARAAGPGWYPPDNVATFAKWCKDVAARYKPGGTLGLSSTTGVTAYEVWNEVNILTFFLSGPNPTTYAAMLAAAYDQLKIEQPNCTVITGGFSPAADDGTNIAPVTFLQGIYSAGAGSKFDALGHHPYCSPSRRRVARRGRRGRRARSHQAGARRRPGCRTPCSRATRCRRPPGR